MTAEAPFQDFPSDYAGPACQQQRRAGRDPVRGDGAVRPRQFEVYGTERRRGSTAVPTRVTAEPLGFEREIVNTARGREVDELLPYDARSFDGYRLLHEFFALPDRFHFLRLGGLQRAFAGKSEREIKVAFLLNRAHSPRLNGKLGARVGAHQLRACGEPVRDG